MADRTITVVGGNLFAVAAAELGDATQAVRIAQRNGGVTDWFLPPGAVTTLRLPPADLTATGGLPAQ